MKNPSLNGLLCLSLLSLAACGGGGSGGGPVTTPPPPISSTVPLIGGPSGTVMLLTDGGTAASQGSFYDDGSGTYAEVSSAATVTLGPKASNGINSLDVVINSAPVSRTATLDGANATFQSGGDLMWESTDGSVVLSSYGSRAGSGLQYSDFGWWDVILPSGQYLTSNYYTGLPTQHTPAASMPTTGTVNYTGQAVATAANATTMQYLEGTINMAANFGTGALTGNINLHDIYSGGAWNPVVLDGAIDSANSLFQGVATTGAVPATVPPTSLPAGTAGTFGGEFFGPNADEAAGQWRISNGTTTVIGAFGTKR